MVKYCCNFNITPFNFCSAFRSSKSPIRLIFNLNIDSNHCGKNFFLISIINTRVFILRLCYSEAKAMSTKTCQTLQGLSVNGESEQEEEFWFVVSTDVWSGSCSLRWSLMYSVDIIHQVFVCPSSPQYYTGGSIIIKIDGIQLHVVHTILHHDIDSIIWNSRLDVFSIIRKLPERKIL